MFFLLEYILLGSNKHFIYLFLKPPPFFSEQQALTVGLRYSVNHCGLPGGLVPLKEQSHSGFDVVLRDPSSLLHGSITICLSFEA